MNPESPAPPPQEESPPAASPADESRPAKVRVRLKGEADGPIYEGQAIIVPCLNCGRK